jgi:cystathionine gamma-synthase
MIHPATLLAHAGFDADPQTGAVVPPIHLATTFQRDDAGEYSGGYVYSRAANPTREQFESLMADLEGGASALAFASGMAAVDALFRLLKPGARIILPKHLYYGVRKLATEVYSSWQVRVTAVSMVDLDEVRMAVDRGCDLLWIETPSNPMVEVVDIAKLTEIGRAAGAIVAVDGTWTTPLLQTPLSAGAHVVIHSVTKYISGHSDVLGGVAVVSDDFVDADRLRMIQQTTGSVMDPFSAWLAMRGARTLAVRIRTQCENAIAIARALAEHQAVMKVHYPGLEDHPGHEIARRQMRAFGGMLSFEVRDAAAALDVVNHCRVFKRATSLGGTESLIEHRASIEENSTTPGGLIRVSAGIEHASDLLDDLLRALSKIS